MQFISVQKVLVMVLNFKSCYEVKYKTTNDGKQLQLKKWTKLSLSFKQNRNKMTTKIRNIKSLITEFPHLSLAQTHLSMLVLGETIWISDKTTKSSNYNKQINIFYNIVNQVVYWLWNNYTVMGVGHPI